jgi:hypothetical protein
VDKAYIISLTPREIFKLSSVSFDNDLSHCFIMKSKIVLQVINEETHTERARKKERYLSIKYNQDITTPNTDQRNNI